MTHMQVYKQAFKNQKLHLLAKCSLKLGKGFSLTIWKGGKNH